MLYWLSLVLFLGQKVSLLRIRNKALCYEQSWGTNLILKIPWIHVPVIDFNMYHDEKHNGSKLSETLFRSILQNAIYTSRALRALQWYFVRRIFLLLYSAQLKTQVTLVKIGLGHIKPLIYCKTGSQQIISDEIVLNSLEPASASIN